MSTTLGASLGPALAVRRFRTRVATRLVVGVAVLLSAAILVLDTHELADLVQDPRSLGTLAVFAMVMITGELLRLGEPNGRSISPIATAAAAALSLCPDVGRTPTTFGCAAVLLTTLGSMGIGAAILRRQQWNLRLSDYAVRVVLVGLVALLYRDVPIQDGLTLLELGQQPGHNRWQAALAMIAVVVLAQSVEFALHVYLRTARSGRPWYEVMREDSGDLGPIAAASMFSAIVVALGTSALGLSAIPIFLLPLVLMRFAIRGQQGTQRARRQAIAALSQLTDLAGYTREGHAQRVAGLCSTVATELQVTGRDQIDLEAAALLHDIGQVSLRRPILDGTTVDLAPRDQQRIADDSAAIVSRTGVLDRAAEIIRVYQTPYRIVREGGGPLMLTARILKVCNAFDDLGAGDPLLRDAALERIMLGLGYEYDPDVVDAVVRTTAPRSGTRAPAAA